MADKVRVTFDAHWKTTVAAIAAPKMFVAAQIVAAAQRAAIPVSRDGSYGRPAGYAQSRIDVTGGIDGYGPFFDIGTDATTPDGTSYPAILDAGSKAHVIESKGDYPLRNRKTGQVFGRRVQHPGTRPTYWCRGSLAALAGRVL